MAYGIWPHEDVSVWCGKLGFWLWSSQAQAAMDAAEDTHIANIAQIPPYDSDIDLMVFGLSETYKNTFLGFIFIIFVFTNVGDLNVEIRCHILSLSF